MNEQFFLQHIGDKSLQDLEDLEGREGLPHKQTEDESQTRAKIDSCLRL